MSANQDALRSFEALFRRQYQGLCQRIARITNDVEAAEDIVQDVFAAFWHQEQQTIEAPEAYLYKACLNRALNYASSTRRKTQLQQEHFRYQPEASESPAQELEYRELEQRVQQAIADLPPMCQKVFLLSRYEEMSHKEIAFFLDISPNTVDNHIKKALHILRKLLLSLFLLLVQKYFAFFL